MNIKRLLLTAGIALSGTFITNVAHADQVTVKSGDTLSSIAQAYGTDYQSLEQINGLDNPDLIYVGDVIETDGAISQIKAPVTVYTPVVDQTPTKVQEIAPVASNSVSEPVKREEPVTGGSAKAQIAMIESTDNYGATNGQYYGKYQLGPDVLKYGTSPAGQERAADEYVADRYGSWDNALSFHQSHGWY